MFEHDCPRSGERMVVHSLTGRRVVLRGSLAIVASTMLAPYASVANTLATTPAQTPGPFYPLTFPQDSDNDLVHVSGHQQTAKGTVTKIGGRILDPNGRAVAGARVEIWQCDANGRYHYVRDGRTDQPLDDNFQGYGAMTTDATGGYEFLTIKPVPYPGRTPHIHFAVSGPGFERLVTQMYVAGDPDNQGDPVLMGIRDPATRARLVVALRPAPAVAPAGLVGVFDIVTGG
jgi:protocatechuate 3,4-dioxygenase, beta subunit